MKKVKKILLIIIVLILVNILFVPNIVKADDDSSLSGVLEEAENGVSTMSSSGQNWLANANLTLGNIFGKFSWLHGLMWAAYIAVGIICVAKYGIPAMASNTFLNNEQKTQRLTAFFAFLAVYILGIFILWKVFPLFVTTDWSA